MRQRTLWALFSTGLATVLLTACANQPAPTTGTTDGQAAAPQAAATTAGATKKPETKIKIPDSIPQQQTAPATKATEPTAAAKTAASPAPQTAPAAKTAASPQAAARLQVTPKGKMTYAWHTAVAPVWLDPQENAALITPYGFQYALHDALVRPMPGNVFTPSLAESYEIAQDQKSATFKIRENAKFHNGEPVTSADVKWTFENYKGANARVLHDKTASVETPDARTVKFNFKEPFLDFLILYATPASGAGWIVPAKYYQEVGPDAFKQKPIGAGPYKFVKQTGNNEYEFEAFQDYWKHAPYVQTLVIRAIPEGATRVAALQAGEVDLINQTPGELIEVIQADPNLQLAPVQASQFWLEFPGYEKPDSPFNDKRVREAVRLALDREAISQAEVGGYGKNPGNWIPENWPGAIQLPPPEFNLQRAKQLMTEAGYPNGFDAGDLTPLPPYNSLGERVISQLREIGITTKLVTMERAAFAEKLAGGPNAFSGLILNISGAPGDAAARIRSFAICPPAGASSRTCDPQIDAKFQQYEASPDPRERERLLNEIQQYIYDNAIFVPVYRQALINAVGPRIANPWDEVIGAIPQYPYIGPYEEIKLKE